jgi:predicted enzyme related to lactoylglutathione lyase
MAREEHDQRIDYVEFHASDLEAIKRFYSGAFGWSFEDWGDDYVSFADGRLQGGFRRGAAVSAAGAPLVVLYARDLERAEATVREHGAEISVGIFSFPGGRRFHFLDPAGNELAVWSDR